MGTSNQYGNKLDPTSEKEEDSDLIESRSLRVHESSCLWVAKVLVAMREPASYGHLGASSSVPLSPGIESNSGRTARALHQAEEHIKGGFSGLKSYTTLSKMT